jgi:trigger factor
MTKNYTDIKITPLPERELEVLGAITAEKMSLMRERALARFKESVEVDGFRKGNAPDAIVAQKVGEMRLLEEAAEIALSEEYPNILEEHKIDAIGRPEIMITKLGVGSPLEFKIKTALMPEVKLANYKKVTLDVLVEKAEGNKSHKAPPTTVGEDEVEAVILNIRKNMAHDKVHRESGGGEKHDHREITDADLPEITEDFVKQLGEFEGVSDLRAKIKENLTREKEIKEKDKKRTEILESIMEKSTIDLPKIIIDGELEKMLAQFKDDIARSGVSYEDYLKHIKKTEEDLKKEWKDTATKRAKSQIILNTIAKEESIAPKEEDVKVEMDRILEHHKDADRFRVRMYVETFMANELVFQFLESQK